MKNLISESDKEYSIIEDQYSIIIILKILMYLIKIMRIIKEKKYDKHIFLNKYEITKILSKRSEQLESVVVYRL